MDFGRCEQPKGNKMTNFLWAILVLHVLSLFINVWTQKDKIALSITVLINGGVIIWGILLLGGAIK